MNDATTLLIGRDAGKNFNFTFQRYSTLVGVSAGYSNSDGSRNSLFGYNAGYLNNHGSNNSFYGYQAGYGNTAGYSNSFFGYEAGVNNTSGTRNTFLGTTADVVSFGDSLDRAIAIGYGAKVDCSHCAVIGGTGLNAVNVGIGITNPKVALEVGVLGDGTRALANKWDLFSDRRWKKDLVQIDDPITKLEAISGYYYYWKEGKDKSRQVGLIAQEVEAILPEVVSTDADGYKSMDYGKMVALLIEALKNQQSEIDLLKNQVIELRAFK